ncbi:DivIVA domain-containing protein [Microbacterium sorbitolivorans]|uniref:DivIVA domain-containing protein n=1 Tax=Microbacterium sorbitolivorans TaxID=1867410 RepID=A0A367Y8W4_9MICO|nr:DivIVA domain-containing protein [Microbacterium sorbitolivorans]RCK61441.1 DivIVA domain-containing protein [Microbacterium sorbitolivorans]GGF32128.1 DivIVA domain-containing protein [Microbacterium sorbitolivorans]
MTQTSVSAPFTRVPWNKRGYEPEAVQAFLDRARASYQGGTGELTSLDVRSASFPLARGGFDMRSVDHALARLEDAFAARERDARIRTGGAEMWVDEARAEAQELLARFGRPQGHRFDRAGALRSGYSVAEVDAVADRLSRFFAHGDPVSADQLRTAAFHPQRGGYREEQVDAVLDAAVRVILAVR